MEQQKTRQESSQSSGDVDEINDEINRKGNESERRLVTESKKDDKVIVMFQATGNAPLLKQTKFKISQSEPFQSVIEFLRRQIHCKPSDQLFLFCNSSFSPAPDALVADLAQCFSVDKCLVINYCLTAAWG
eukprot:c8220_g1_i2.p1 GENE.c8220_g1_i2~~c8220_g1_i2.p1  ORF type:complete len:138 (+),score=49.28 c8220_g1_i2:24-416(+)